MPGDPYTWDGIHLAWSRKERGGKGLDQWYTLRQVADALNVARITVLRWIKAGFLVAVQVSARPGGKYGHYRIQGHAIDKFTKWLRAGGGKV